MVDNLDPNIILRFVILAVFVFLQPAMSSAQRVPDTATFSGEATFYYAAGCHDHPIRDPREAKRMLLLDTYRTFGCDSGQPTYRYALLDGVKDGYLINPAVVDARTEITTELLSEEGFVVTFIDDAGEDQEGSLSGPENSYLPDYL